MLESEKQLALISHKFNINLMTKTITEKLQKEVNEQTINIRSVEITEIDNALKNLNSIVPIYDNVNSQVESVLCNFNFEQLESEYFALLNILNLPPTKRQKRNLDPDSSIANEYIKNWKIIQQTAPPNGIQDQEFVNKIKNYINILDDESKMPLKSLKIIATDFDVFLGRQTSGRLDYVLGIKTIMNLKMGLGNTIITRSGKVLLSNNPKRKLDEELAVQQFNKEPRVIDNVDNNRRKQASNTLQNKIQQGKNSKDRIDNVGLTTNNYDDEEIIIYEKSTKATLLNEIVNSGFTVENLRITPTELQLKDTSLNNDITQFGTEPTLNSDDTVTDTGNFEIQLTGQDIHKFINAIPSTTTSVDITDIMLTKNDFEITHMTSKNDITTIEIENSIGTTVENSDIIMDLDDSEEHSSHSNEVEGFTSMSPNVAPTTGDDVYEDTNRIDDINHYDNEYYRNHIVTKRQNHITQKDANQDKLLLDNTDEIYKLRDQSIQSRINQISWQLNKLGENFVGANREVLGKICGLKIFGIVRQVPLQVYTQQSKAAIMRPVTFCTDQFCYQLIMDQLFIELQNGLKCHNAKVLRDGYGICLEPLNNHDHICALDQNTKLCKYKEIAYEDAKYERFNEGTAILNPHENIIYNNIIDKQTKIEGHILDKSSKAYLLPRGPKLLYVFTKRQIRNSYVDQTSYTYRLYELIENAQHRDTLTYIGVILGIFGIFGLISQISSVIYKILCVHEESHERENNRVNVVKIKEDAKKAKQSSKKSESRPLSYKIVRVEN